ncbi:hypothetical protein SAMN05421545_3961 [Pontibacter lucknowensis]|uniref:Uncharacterized protein n=1 Tax=Pontibacter lucknowensis TaxID=1077936 RepID=A0A1N7BGK8_9BACT|nr:hypothetical protein SAMN05421545_3961 [Pontibacter lucknowensis]
MIRWTILVKLLLLSCTSIAQTRVLPDTSKIKVSNTFWVKPGSYYLDSVEIDLKKVYLDPENILEVKSVKGTDSYLFSGSRSATLYTRKVKDPLISLADIKIENYPADSKRIRFLIDGKLIEDTTGIKLETTTIKRIEVLRHSKSKAAHGYENLTQILISTKIEDKKRKNNSY